MTSDWSSRASDLRPARRGWSGWRLALAACILAHAPAKAGAFSIGVLPGLNCTGPTTCRVADFLGAQNVVYEEVHQIITREALGGVQFARRGTVFSQAAIFEIESANALSDYDQGDHDVHFDDDFLQEGSARLIQGKGLILGLLRRGGLGLADARLVREIFGGLTHTIQDFFAHTNWVTLLSAHAAPDFGNASLANPGLSVKPCVPLLFNNGQLTDQGYSNLVSGFAIAPLPEAIAPPGQCAHGLVGNGIHKDWTGRPFHDAARAAAREATARFARSVLDDPGNDPDAVCMFMTDRACPAPVVIDFDSLSTSGGPVMGAALYAYFATFGVSVAEGPGAGLNVQAAPPWESTSSPPNILNTFGSPATLFTGVTYTLTFSSPLASVSFTRAGIAPGSTMGLWSATASSATGQVLSSVGESHILTATAPQQFTLGGPGIVSVTFSSNVRGFAGTYLGIDDLVLTP